MNVIKCRSRVTSPRNKLSGCPGNVQLENKERAFFMDPIKRWWLPLAFQPNCFCPLSTPCRDAMGKQERASRRRRKQTATVATSREFNIHSRHRPGLSGKRVPVSHECGQASNSLNFFGLNDLMCKGGAAAAKPPLLHSYRSGDIS